MRHVLSPMLFIAMMSAGVAFAQEDWSVIPAGLGNGETDCTAAFQQQLDAAGEVGGGIVNVPAGRYRIEGTLSLPENVTLQGILRSASTARSIDEASGSVLLAYAGRGEPEGAPFIDLAGDNSSIVGLTIVYPEWSMDEVPPVPYPPCVASTDTLNVSIQECMLLNPYEAIRLIRAHRHLVRNVTGYPIKSGIFVDECYDIGHIENIHFWPFGTAYSPDHPYSKWINTEGVAFELARTDWEYVFNTFCFGYGVGYKFSASENGSTNGNFLGLGADSCERAVVVEQAQSPGLLITNGEFVGRWSSTEAVCVEVGPEVEGKVSLVNCSFWGPIDRCVWMRSPNGQFTANACNFVSWDVRGVGAPALQIDAGRAMIQGCTFGQGDLGVHVGPEAISAIITGNQASGGLRVENEAGDHTQIALNEADPVVWTDEARGNYRIDVGAPGDDRYLRGFSGRERLGEPFRWSQPSSQLLLPVPPGEACTITVEGDFPEYAIGEDSGLYLGDTLLSPLEAGATLSAELPATSEDHVRLELRCHGWIPQEIIPGSVDPRVLGVQVTSVTVTTVGVVGPAFLANTGMWLAE